MVVYADVNLAGVAASLLVGLRSVFRRGCRIGFGAKERTPPPGRAPARPPLIGLSRFLQQISSSNLNPSRCGSRSLEHNHATDDCDPDLEKTR